MSLSRAKNKGGRGAVGEWSPTDQNHRPPGNLELDTPCDINTCLPCIGNSNYYLNTLLLSARTMRHIIWQQSLLILSTRISFEFSTLI